MVAQVKVQKKSKDKTAAAQGSLPLTETGNAQRLVQQHGGDLRYVVPWKRWLYWDGCRWARDDRLEAERRAQATVAGLSHEAAGMEQGPEKAELLKWAARSQSAGMVGAMLRLAGPRLVVEHGKLDRDAYLLNVENGTLDLRTGQLREHRREDYMTKLAPTLWGPELFRPEDTPEGVPWQEYCDAGEMCPQWISFLREIFPGPDGGPDEELIGFVQRFLGYCLSGSVQEHVMATFWGSGANGKSTLLNAVLAMLGEDYAIQGAADLLLSRSWDAHPTEVADLHGKRLVVCSETDRGRRLNEARVKALTGGDRIRARRMREDHWEFDPTHKVVLVTNHRPEIRGRDAGIWRRQRLVPFAVSIPEDQQDQELPQKLRWELPAILAWCVQGFLAWQEEGLGLSRAITEATAGYRLEEDVLQRFMDECCVVNQHAQEKASSLYDAYSRWAEANGEEVEKSRDFNRCLRERGFADKKASVIVFEGIGLRQEDESDAHWNR